MSDSHFRQPTLWAEALGGDTAIHIGVSACLMGHEVRFDSGHKRSRFVTDVLADRFSLVPMCPEVGSGLPTPRPTIRQVAVPQNADGDSEIRLHGAKVAGIDATDPLVEWSAHKADQLAHLSGFILKKDSPSCGLARVRVYKPNGDLLHRDGVGLFTAALKQRYPDMPMEDEGRLNDAGLRENFITRVYLYAYLQRMQQARADGSTGLTRQALIAFHSRVKLSVLAHSPEDYKALGKLLADLTGADLDDLFARYRARLMDAMRKPATRGRHANVLQHLAGHLREKAANDDRAELTALIDAYRRGEVPLVVPITMLRHHLKRHPDTYANRQHYLWPYPDDLALNVAI